jgi:hypothetical protein
MATVMSAYPAIADVTDHSACSTAGKIAEAASGIPSNLLVSIGIVESGRSDPATGRAAPWPWTVNADGSGHYFSNKADAISYVEEREASGWKVQKLVPPVALKATLMWLYKPVKLKASISMQAQLLTT